MTDKQPVDIVSYFDVDLTEWLEAAEQELRDLYARLRTDSTPASAP